MKFPDEMSCEVDGVCSVCGDRAHAVGPTLTQFRETLMEMLDELGCESIYLYDKGDLEDFRTVIGQAWERAKTQRV